MRSAFLVKVGISTEAFVGTNAVLGFMVDIARITAYTGLFFGARTSNSIPADEWPIVLAAIGGAAIGVFSARLFLQEVTMDSIQILTGVLLLGVALALGAGVI